MKLRAVVPCEPVPQGRPRFRRVGDHVIAYDPAKSREYKRIVQLVARSRAPERPLEGAVRLTLVIYRAVPKSASKRKAGRMLEGRIRPTTKPDISNVLKGVEDALKGIWYKDDSQIVEYGEVSKYYGEEPKIIVEVEEIEQAF